MSRIVLANWKASLAPERALAWCDSFSAAYTPRTGLEVVLAVPALVMDRVHQRLGALAGRCDLSRRRRNSARSAARRGGGAGA